VQGKGYGMGVSVADYDNDGFEDIYLPGVNYNQLLHNNGDGTFTDVTEKAGLTGIDKKFGKTWAISAGWFDYDNDGLLDLLVVNYVRWSVETERPCTTNNFRAYCSPDAYQGLPDMLYHNNGDGTFTDVSEKSGIAKHVGKGMGVAFADTTATVTWTCSCLTTRFRNFLFHNEHNGTFTETGILNGIAYNENGKSIAGMGCDFKDVDNDGRPDIFVTGMVGDTWPLFRNRGRDFQDITSSSGIARASAPYTAWGAGIFDFDNDGWRTCSRRARPFSTTPRRSRTCRPSCRTACSGTWGEEVCGCLGAGGSGVPGCAAASRRGFRGPEQRTGRSTSW